MIAAECDDRRKRDHRINSGDIAEWLVLHNRAAVIAGLSDLVCQVMEQRNDDKRVERVLRAKPELQPVEELLRQVSQALGVGLWYLLERDDERQQQCCAAAHLIHRLRSEEATASLEAMERFEEFVRPIMDGHPSMTVGEAIQEMQRKTDETIRGLEPPEGAR